MGFAMPWTEDSKDVRVPDAYYRVSNLVLDPVSQAAQWDMLVYWSRATRDDPQKSAMGSFRVVVGNLTAGESADRRAHPFFDEYFADAALRPAGATPLAQAYRWMREHHPIFADAVDVLEDGQIDQGGATPLAQAVEPKGAPRNEALRPSVRGVV